MSVMQQTKQKIIVKSFQILAFICSAMPIKFVKQVELKKDLFAYYVFYEG